MTLKFTMYFSLPGYSWTESHYNSTTDVPNGITATSFARALAAARAQCLGTAAGITRVRISNVPANREVYDVRPPFIVAQGRYGPVLVSQFTNSLAAICPGLVLLIRLRAGSAANTVIFMGGCPGAIFTEPGIGNQGYDLSLAPGFSDALGAYMQYLVPLGAASNSWGFESSAQSLEATYVNASQGLVTNAQYPGCVGIVTQNPLIGSVAPGTQMKVKGWRRLSMRSPGLSGVYRTFGATLVTTGPPQTWTYFLNNTPLVQPSNFFTIGQICEYIPSFIPYTFYNIVGATTRKRGARTAAHRGRSSIRI